MINKISITRIVWIFSLIFFQNVTGLSQDQSQEEKKRTCIVGVWPSDVDQVNGLMFNFWSKDVNEKQLREGTIDLPTTNGIELNLNPAGPIAAGMFFFYGLLDGRYQVPLDERDPSLFKNYRKINGVQIALLNMEPTAMNGLEIHLAGSFQSTVNGISISFVMSKRYRLNGLGIGLVGNSDTEVNGV